MAFGEYYKVVFSDHEFSESFVSGGVSGVAGAVEEGHPEAWAAGGILQAVKALENHFFGEAGLFFAAFFENRRHAVHFCLFVVALNIVIIQLVVTGELSFNVPKLRIH